MGIRVALLVVAAIIAVTAAYPHGYQALAAGLNCNQASSHTADIGSDSYTLKGCTSQGGSLCISGLPSQKCSFTGQCYNFYWYTGSFCWSSIICQNPFSSGHCYKTGNIHSCSDVWQAQEMQQDATLAGVKICEDIGGASKCRSLSEGMNAEAMKDPDCFCVKDTKGNKVCEPDGCDKGKAAP